MGKFRNTLSGIVLSGLTALGGCSRQDFGDTGFYYAPNAGAQIEILEWKVKKLGPKIQTTQAHSDDKWLFSGQTTTDIATKGEELKGSGLTLYGEGAFGYKKEWLDTRAGIGFGARINNNEADEYHEGIFDWKQQENDHRHPWRGAFVYTEVKPGEYTLIPQVGAELTLFDRITFRGEVGFPWMEWETESGHDRYGRYESVQKEESSQFGQRYVGKVKLRLTEPDKKVEVNLSIGYAHETHTPKFAEEKAEIEGKGWLFGLDISW